MKKIYILLTRLPNPSSKWIGLLTNSYYSHTSIGLEEDKDVFYSFVHKGFRVERLSWYQKNLDVACQIYEMNVSEKTYEWIKSIIQYFLYRKEQFQYNAMGAVMCLLHIPYHRRRNYYFCSQFVAEVLKEAKVLRLKKKTTCYRPSDFASMKEFRLVYHGRISKIDRA